MGDQRQAPPPVPEPPLVRPANNGNTFADTGYQDTWEVTRAQPGASRILVDYTGGAIGANFENGTPTPPAQQFPAQLEPLLPGITAEFNGRATIDFWAAYPWTKGSYSYGNVGQYASFATAEREPSFDRLFAGKPTSIDFQGYLNRGHGDRRTRSDRDP